MSQDTEDLYELLAFNAASLKTLVTTLISNSQYKDKLPDADSIVTGSRQSDAGFSIYAAGNKDEKANELMCEGLHTALHDAEAGLHVQKVFDSARIYVGRDLSSKFIPASDEDIAPLQQNFDETVLLAEKNFYINKYQEKRDELEPLFQSLIEASPAAFDENSKIDKAYIEHENGKLEIWVKNDGEGNRNEQQRRGTKDAKILANALKEIFSEAGIADIHVNRRTLIISPHIMEQLEAKQEAGTLTTEFAEAMNHVHANAQQRGGRG